MDSITLLISLMTAIMFAISFHAWRHGNERRDVALLGVIGGLGSVGTAAVAFV